MMLFAVETHLSHQLKVYNSPHSEHDFAQVVETSVIVNNNSSFQNYTNPDYHSRQTGFFSICNRWLKPPVSEVIHFSYLASLLIVSLKATLGFPAMTGQLYSVRILYKGRNSEKKTST